MASGTAGSATCRDPLASSAPPTIGLAPSTVCLVPFRLWARLLLLDQPKGKAREARTARAAAAAAALVGGVHFAGTVTALRRRCGLVNPDLMLRLDREKCRAAVSTGYAMVTAGQLSLALAWHNSDSNFSAEVVNGGFYPLVLRISVVEANLLTLKISQKDNAVDNFKRADRMFKPDSQRVHFWDFTGQAMLMLKKKRNKPHIRCCHANKETLLEVQAYEVFNSSTSNSGWTYKETSVSSAGSMGLVGLDNFNSGWTYKETSVSSAGSMGLVGLDNLGNTCYMNCSIQCLVHTPEFATYFLRDYDKNLILQNGGLALAFGELLRCLWTTDRKSVSPKYFKEIFDNFCSWFRGTNQHDSQEFLGSLLDGLHYDLSQSNHPAENDSVIIDTFYGQYRSRLTCLTCNAKSDTFDPVAYLSLPVPFIPKMAMTVTILSTDGSSKPFSCDIIVLKSGTVSDLLQSLSSACLLADDELLLLAEVRNSYIIRYLENPSFPLSLLMDVGKLAAYRLPKKNEKSPHVVFTHQYFDEEFGVPLLAAVPDTIDGLSLQRIFMKLLSPFRSSEMASSLNDCTESSNGSFSPMDTLSSDSDNNSQNNASQFNLLDFMNTSDSDSESQNSYGNSKEELEFYLKNEKGDGQLHRIETIDELDLLETASSNFHVIVQWPYNLLRRYDASMLGDLPEIHKREVISVRNEDSVAVADLILNKPVALNDCLEAFLKEEPLGADNMWNCPRCKTKREALKKLDLWRLPKVLVIHLKRFYRTQSVSTKIETYVDFPINDLDLSAYIANQSMQSSSHYRLYAISNHYGDTGGGHYTATIYHEEKKRWYKFDDSCVTPMTEDEIKTSAPYVLFYRRQ